MPHQEVTEDTRVEDVKAPGIFQRVKEEAEAVVQGFHGKHDVEEHAAASGSLCCMPNIFGNCFGLCSKHGKGTN